MTEAEATQPRTWTMYAAKKRDGALAHFHPHPDIVILYGIRQEDVVPVVLTEDPGGDLAGWVRTGRDDVTLVERHEIFEIQFPYGSQAEIDRGHGEVVRLRAEEAGAQSS